MSSGLRLSHSDALRPHSLQPLSSPVVVPHASLYDPCSALEIKEVSTNQIILNYTGRWTCSPHPAQQQVYDLRVLSSPFRREKERVTAPWGVTVRPVTLALTAAATSLVGSAPLADADVLC